MSLGKDGGLMGNHSLEPARPVPHSVRDLRQVTWPFGAPVSPSAMMIMRR